MEAASRSDRRLRANIVIGTADGGVESVCDLAGTIDKFVTAYDEHDTKPYRWTYGGTPLKPTYPRRINAALR